MKLHGLFLAAIGLSLLVHEGCGSSAAGAGGGYDIGSSTGDASSSQVSTGQGGGESASVATGTTGSSASVGAGGGESGGGGAGGSDTCSADAVVKTLTMALASAKPGTIISPPACLTPIMGPITVPAGVILKGNGVGKTVITSMAGSSAIVFAPGAKGASKVSDLSIKVEGFGIYSDWPGGDVTIDDVNVDIVTGVGVALEGLANVEATNLIITGPVGANNLGTLPEVVDPKNTGTHGVVLFGVGTAAFTGAQITGLADYGALLVNTNATWTGGYFGKNRGTGLYAAGGKITLAGLQIYGMFKDTRTLPAYGAVFSNGAVVKSTNLKILDNEGIGVLHDGSVHDGLKGGALAHHSDVIGTGNHAPAIWAQDASGLTIDGAAPMFGNNRFAGLVAVSSKNVIVMNAVISGTTKAKLPLGPLGKLIAAGDGVELVDSTKGIWFKDVKLSGNGRAALLLDLVYLDVANADLMWKGVTVDAAGSALGAICQGASEVWGPGVLSKWDQGILRTGKALANDTGVTKPIERVGIIDPNFMPAPTTILTGGIKMLNP